MIDQAEAVEDSDIQERMAALLESEEDNPVELEQVADEEQETEETEVEDEVESEEEETLELSWNGEVKALKKSEVVELAQKGFDYTIKTQQLAEQRKAQEAQAQQFQLQAGIQAQLADKYADIKALDNQIAQYKALDWQNIPLEQYIPLKHQFDALKEQKNEMVGEYQARAQQLTQAQQALQAQRLAHETRLMTDAIPELRGKEAQQTVSELKAYLASSGFSDAEIGGIMDHRAIKIAIDAMKFAKLKTAQPAVKKRMTEAPKVIKGKQPAPNNAVRDLKEKARRGDESAIRALIERTL